MNANKATLVVVVLALSARPSSATQYYGWADEFLTGMANCHSEGNGCHVLAYWSGDTWLDIFEGVNLYDITAPATFTHVGQQFIASKANARSKVSSRLYDTNTSRSYSMTTTLSRRDSINGPSQGAVCNNTWGLFVGSSSFTISTLGLQLQDLKAETRLLPTMNFSHHSWGVNHMAYNETIAINAVTESGNMSSTQEVSCFKIRWL